MRQHHMPPYAWEREPDLVEQLARHGTPDAFLQRERLKHQPAPSPAFWRGLVIGVFITLVLLFVGVVGFLAVQLAITTLN